MSLSMSQNLRPPAKLPCTAGIPIGKSVLKIRQHEVTHFGQQGSRGPSCPDRRMFSLSFLTSLAIISGA
jgi:hypothetical protein